MRFLCVIGFVFSMLLTRPVAAGSELVEVPAAKISVASPASTYENVFIVVALGLSFFYLVIADNGATPYE